MELLVVEDETLLGKSIERGLREAGHVCTLLRNGAEGLSMARARRFDTIILDIMLPELTGLQVVETLRKESVLTPVLLLTALGSVENRVSGFEHGADDYLVKPFAFAELLARVNALCRRSGLRAPPCHQVGPLQLDLSTRKVTRADRDVDLSPTEFSILEFLMRHVDEVVTRRMLNEHFWGENWDGMTNVIDVYINRLRKKIDKGQDASLIHTVRGQGYILKQPPMDGDDAHSDAE